MPNPTSKPTPAGVKTDHKPPAGVKPTDKQPTPAASIPKPAATPTPEPDFDWASLPAIEVEPTNSAFARGVKVDIEKEIPAAVRNDVEEALKKHLAKVVDATDGNRVRPVYVLKNCKTPEMAEKFTAMVKRYGKFRPAGQLTVRGGPTKVDPTVVRFSAKPLESRSTDSEKPAEKSASSDK